MLEIFKFLSKSHPIAMTQFYPKSLATFFSTKERIGLYSGFLLLWIYLIIRSHTVFLIMDEVVTKWSYMVEWNPLPYMGHIDANNHFLNSFLGGLFYRIFQSDAPWVIRLPSILAFPLFYWSLVRFVPFFKQKISFYGFLTTLALSAFIIEYFALARGYGLSIALFMAGFQFLLYYFQGRKSSDFFGVLICFVLACYSNMSLVPLILLVLVYLSVHICVHKNFSKLIFVSIALLPILYAIQYSFHLKEIGKLYYGGENGFFTDTVHSLTQYLWNLGSPILDGFLSILFVGLMLTATKVFLKEKNIFSAPLVIYVFVAASVANILAQHYILGVKFPEDRAAIYLPLLFLTALFFTLDFWKLKWVSTGLVVIALAGFYYDFNFEKSKFFYYEHFDEELISLIPEKINGIPPTTGGRFWKMDNERMRQSNLRTSAFQNTHRLADTLHDYIISTKVIRPDLLLGYHVLYEDPISKLTLFERNTFLKRELLQTYTVNFSSQKEFLDFLSQPLTEPIILRIYGTLYQIDDTKSFPVLVTTENTVKNELVIYDGLNFLESSTINDNQEIDVDISFAVGLIEGSNLCKSYIYNPKGVEVLGDFTVEIYSLHN